MKYCFILFLLILLPSFANAERVKKVKVKKDQIVQVKTAIGVATIIQVADNPTSLVVGDNEGFKVEFLDQAITIKPLHANARSNLYIYTEYRRFDIELVTVQERSADYVVYLETVVAPLKLKPLVKWNKTDLRFKNDDLQFRIRRLGQSDSSLYIEFEVSSSKNVDFDPGWIWIQQSKSTVPIHRLVMSSFKADQSNSIKGVVELLKDDLNLAKSFSFEIRRKAKTQVDIPRALKW